MSKAAKGKGGHKREQNDDAREEIKKMRIIISAANAQRQFLGPNASSQESGAHNRLEFSHNTISSYKLHSKVAQGLLLNPNTKCITTYNEKGMHMWDPLTLKQHFKNQFSQDKSSAFIECICYSRKWHLYFACMQNFKLLVLNEYLKVIRIIDLDFVRLVQSCHFIDETNQLVTAGVGGSYLIDMIVEYRYSPQQAILLDPKGTSIKVAVKVREEPPPGGFNDGSIIGSFDPEVAKVDRKMEVSISQVGISASMMPPEPTKSYTKLLGLNKWAAGVICEPTKKLLVQWSKKNVYFYNFKVNRRPYLNATDVRIYKNITTTEDFITSIALFDSLNYFVIGKHFGDMVVYKYDEFQEFQKKDATSKIDILAGGGSIGSKQGMNLGNLDKSPGLGQSQKMQNPSEMGFTCKTEDDISLNHLVVRPKFIHTFKGHTRGVTSMVAVRTKTATGNTYVSSSLDGTVRVWCLDKLISLYVFDINEGNSDARKDDKLTNIMMLNPHTYALFYAGQENSVEIGQISHLAQSYHISRQNIMQVSKAFSDCHKERMNEPKSLVIGFDNNSTFLLNPADGLTKSTIYPPPSSTKISRTLFCMALKRVIVMLENGSFCVYRVHKRSTGKLDKMMSSKGIRSYAPESKSLTQKVTCMSLGSIVPPMEDCEIFSKIQRPNLFSKEPQLNGDSDSECSRASESNDEEEGDNNENQPPKVGKGEAQDIFLLLGLAKGAIVFVRVDCLDKIYARFSPGHKLAIEHIYEIRKQEKILTICEEFKMLIWGFTEDLKLGGQKMQVYQEFNLGFPLNQIRVLNDSLFFIYPSGETRLLRWCGDNQCLKTKFVPAHFDEDEIEPTVAEMMKDSLEKTRSGIPRTFEDMTKVVQQIEHEVAVLSVDIHEHLGLFATGDKEGLIKIWNKKKEIVREIKFTEPITALVFLNKQADLVIGHGSTLSRIKAQAYVQPANKFNEMGELTEGMFYAKDYDEFIQEERPVTRKYFDRLYLNYMAQRKLEGSLGPRVKKQVAFEDEDQEDIMTMEGALAATKKLQAERQAKVTGRSHTNTHTKKISSDVVGDEDTHVLQQALGMAIDEQNKRDVQRTKEAQRQQPRDANKSKVGSQGDDNVEEHLGSCAITLRAEARDYLNNLKAGATLAIPKGSMKGSKRAKTSKPMTRQQRTRDRIMDNIAEHNKPTEKFSHYQSLGIYMGSTSTGCSTMIQASPAQDNKNEDFGAQANSTHLADHMVSKHQDLDKTTLSSEEPHSASFNQHSRSGLMRPNGQFDKPAIVEVYGKKQLRHSSKYFSSSATMEGPNMSIAVSGSQNKHGSTQQSQPQITAQMHPISAHGQREMVQTAEGERITVGGNLKSNGASSHNRVLSIDTGVSSVGGNKTLMGARTFSSGAGRTQYQPHLQQRPSTMGNGIGTRNAGILDNLPPGAYAAGVRGHQNPMNRNRMKIRQTQKQSSIAPMFQQATSNFMYKQEPHLLVNLPTLIDDQRDHSKTKTHGSTTKLDLRMAQAGGVQQQFHTRAAPNTAVGRSRPKQYGTRLAGGARDANGPQFDAYNTLSQGLSQPPNYQVKQGIIDPKKLGTANSSDLNFMLGPKQGGATSQTKVGMRTSDPHPPSSIFQSGIIAPIAKGSLNNSKLSNMQSSLSIQKSNK